MTNAIAPLAITCGDPAGIGPDCIVQCLTRPPIEGRPPWVILGDPDVLAARARALGLSFDLPEYHPDRNTPRSILPITCPSTVTPGIPNTDNNPHVFAMIDHAINGCQRKTFSAMVTGPVNKAVLQHSQPLFCGHTEYLAFACNVSHPVMLFASDHAPRLALLTTHIPFQTIAAQVTAERLTTTIRVLAEALQRIFHIEQPCIWVTGLNPHAGEAGSIGNEETTIIQPTIDALRKKGIDVNGPISADTAFQHCHNIPCDVILSLYHDQLLPAFKALSFHTAVNMTLGLPILRVSVDHGTAFALAGTDKASCQGFLYAIDYASTLVTNHNDT